MLALAKEVQGKSQSNSTMSKLMKSSCKRQVNDIAVAKCKTSEEHSKQNAQNSNCSLGLYSMQNAETLTTHTHSIMLKKKLEHGTPTVALTQSFSSEALQALLLEKCFTNCFAVGLLDLDRKGRVYK
jgi:hypothetical protein